MDLVIHTVLAGNESRNKQRWGRADANAGLVLAGDGTGRFSSVPQARSGLRLRGDVRDVLVREDLLLFGVRGAEMQAYRLAE